MTRFAVAVSALVFAASCASAVAEGPSPSPAYEGATFEVPSAGDAVVVRYQQVVGALEDPDPGPSLTVYGDGRMIVHYPRYMKRAGDYEVWLGAEQVEALVTSLVEKGVAEIDPGSVAAEVEEAAASQPTLFESSETTTTVIELRLDSYRPSGATSEVPATGFEKSVTWQGLRPQARLYPGVESLQRLAAAERELAALLEHEDLERVAK